MRPSSTARLLLVTAAVLFSTGGAAIKATAFSAYQVASLRSGIAALTLLLLIPAARRGWSWRALAVGVTYAATLFLFVVANKLTTSANTIFLQSTAPLYLLVLAPWLLREPLRLKDVWFMVAVGVGLALFFVTRDAPVATAPDPFTGNLLAAISGVTWALTLIGLRWLGSTNGGESQYPAMVAGNALVFIVVLPLALPLAQSTPLDWGVIIYLGAIQIGVAYACLAKGIRDVPAVEASILLLVEPALNPLWAWGIHGEVPSVLALTGAGIIFGATVVRSVMESREARARSGELRVES